MKKESKVLLAGQWVGEFGWELFCWQGYVRKMSKQYDKTIVVSRTKSEFLYKDFADVFIGVDSPATQANMWLGQGNGNVLTEIIRKHNPTHHLKPFNIGYNPSREGGSTGNKFHMQDYVKYESNSLKKYYDILLHARNKHVGSNRNWDKDKWVKLAKLLKDDNYTIATIGSDEAFAIEGVDDFRNAPIKDTVALMNRCQMVVGQSSGPLHLASLSGAKHFVWSDHSNFLRYTKHWNPFNTEIIFYEEEGWNPKVDSLYSQIKKAL